MRDIDEMDMLGYLEIRAWNAQKNNAKPDDAPQGRFIDEVWPGLCP